ncbi:MAG: magnesium transporter [Verrucomicrobiae bacterium]|nr:magnesium transporter [Verrucomicrobiae bacterium]MCP5520541.1 magnesium transporter [Verrucomicrobiales bacterium]
MSEETNILPEELIRLHPADIADRLERLPLEEAGALLRALPADLAGRALSEMAPETAGDLMEGFDSSLLASLFENVSAHVVADLAALVEGAKLRSLLDALPGELREHVTGLLAYASDTAGGIMSGSFIAIRADRTIEEAQQRIRQRGRDSQPDVSYLYVTDGARRLVGVLPLRDLVFARRDQRVGDVMSRTVRALRVDADREEIAREFEHYHFLALPVLDLQSRLVGIVKASDALHVAQAEATEDMQLMVGLSGEERVFTPWRRSLGQRLPWLYVNLATAFAAAAVVGLFEGAIQRWTALALFLPVIAGQGGNAGMQTLTIVVRDMALGEMTMKDGRRVLLKELLLALINGLAIGLTVGMIGWFWKGSVELGLVAGAAMVLNTLAAAFSGVAIPLTLKAVRLDPALASSILLTTVTDVAGFFFFLGLAVLAMHSMGL